ncbi:hypothetical protein NCC49_002558 [Naganishia albida]|nr:hypothetical protein NCC49_002558 [Naganishia albida]
MVSFQCDGCGDTIKKPQLDKHRNRCWSTFSCIDCSTTFHGTDYKAHTSCISEAEKYQGALYKGKKGGQGGHAGNNAKPAVTQTPAPAAAEPAPAPAPAAPAIHPSRSALLAGPEPGPKPRANRTGFPGLHPGANYPPPRVYGRPAREQQQRSTKNWATGMNGHTGEGPMRSWGGSPAPEDVDPAKVAVNEKAVEDLVVKVPITVTGEVEGEGKKKKKKRKGDKGGTGSRANSNAAKKEAESAQPTTTTGAQVAGPQSASSAPAEQNDAVKAVAEAPAVVIPAAPLASESTSSKSKKRKATEDAAEDSSESSSKKTSKKLRKALSSLATSEKSVPLSTLIEKISEQVSKKKTGEVIDATGIARDIKVTYVDGAAGEQGKWVLEV